MNVSVSHSFRLSGLLALGLLGLESVTWAEFPKDFQWCTATAAHQIEGANSNSDWWEFELSKDSKGQCRVKNCEASGKAVDHWNRIDEDITLMSDLGANAYRFSVEWAKIEPVQGSYSKEAIAHYRTEVKKLKLKGIEPLITLQHFTLPLWLARKGGWAWAEMPAHFEKFARLVFTEIAPDCRTWVTVNEPLVSLGAGYVTGVMPPGQGEGFSDLKALLNLQKPMRGLLESHARAYRVLHQLASGRGSKIQVGMAHHLRVFDAKRKWWPLDHLAAKAVAQIWNWSIPYALKTGVWEIGIPFSFHLREEFDGLAGTQDFFGINYYTRDLVKLFPGFEVGLSGEAKSQGRLNDLGWEIYPEGFYRLLKEISTREPGLPILVTENGIADGADSKRELFLKDHLSAMERAISEGSRVVGYCHWSLMDNFEWTEGRAPRFGLFAVDYSTPTLKRSLRASARVFQAAAQGRSISLKTQD